MVSAMCKVLTVPHISSLAEIMLPQQIEGPKMPVPESSDVPFTMPAGGWTWHSDTKFWSNICWWPDIDPGIGGMGWGSRGSCASSWRTSLVENGFLEHTGVSWIWSRQESFRRHHSSFICRAGTFKRTVFGWVLRALVRKTYTGQMLTGTPIVGA